MVFFSGHDIGRSASRRCFLATAFVCMVPEPLFVLSRVCVTMHFASWPFPEYRLYPIRLAAFGLLTNGVLLGLIMLFAVLIFLALLVLFVLLALLSPCPRFIHALSCPSQGSEVPPLMSRAPGFLHSM